MVVYPGTKNELLYVVFEGTQLRQKMHVVTRFSHSMTKLARVDRESVKFISTEYLNNTLGIGKEAITITVESGVSLRQLIEDAAKARLALRMAPHWWGLTVGDNPHDILLASQVTIIEHTVVLGSGPAFHDYVTEMRMVTLADHDEGYATVMAQLELMFKREITYITVKDSDLVETVEKYRRRFKFPDIMCQTVIKEEIELQMNAEGIFTLARDIPHSLSSQSYGLTNNGTTYYGYPMNGNHSDLMSPGGCLDRQKDRLATACPWDSRVKGQFIHQTTFTLPLENVNYFINDIKSLVQIEPKALCSLDLYSGIFIRYIHPSFAYLGGEFEDMEFEFTYYRSRDPLVTRMYQDFMEEIKHISLLKYDGIPHWGKKEMLHSSTALTSTRTPLFSWRCSGRLIL
ncbi:unnamed protein product [Thlaspi arvense]|uniref:FAD-binding PCMH-type domain-containing protein n=1 Tax=Thlaspi arvense TaxID=13288 RepID=A0AAU9RXG7_THLAR|nr:unnamed protein product [Thlaspi arvense]